MPTSIKNKHKNEKLIQCRTSETGTTEEGCDVVALSNPDTTFRGSVKKKYSDNKQKVLLSFTDFMLSFCQCINN